MVTARLCVGKVTAFNLWLHGEALHLLACKLLNAALLGIEVVESGLAGKNFSILGHL